MKKKTPEQKEARFQVKERAYRDQIAKLQKLVKDQHSYILYLHGSIKHHVGQELEYPTYLTESSANSESRS